VGGRILPIYHCCSLARLVRTGPALGYMVRGSPPDRMVVLMEAFRAVAVPRGTRAHVNNRREQFGACWEERIPIRYQGC
jgi:hypothetical protein